jgi:tetratricopeptide (TPR) repeat protein
MAVHRPAPVDAFVRRILSTEDDAARHRCIERTRLGQAEAAAAARRLIEEAERLIGVDPRRMAYLCQAALDLALRAGDRYLWAMARFKQGEATTLQGRSAEGRVYLDEAEETFRSLDRPVEAARTRIIWVWATANLGGDEEAVRAARKARLVLADHREDLYTATLDVNTGILHCLRGRHQTGVRYFRSALTLYQTVGNEERAERTRHNLGLALSRLGRYREALVELQRVLDSARRSGQTRYAALAVRAIGETHLRLGRHTAALQALEDARSLYDTVSLHDGAVTLALDLADCYLRLNRPAEALTVLDETAAHLSHVDATWEICGLASRRAAAQVMLNQPQEALSTLEAAADHALAAPAEQRAWLALQRASVLVDQGRAEAALEATREAGVIARRAGLRPLLAETHLIEGQACRAVHDMDRAKQAAGRARRLGRAQDAAPVLQRAHELLGRIAEDRGQLAAASRHYVAAIAQYEREQRSVIFEFRHTFAAGRTSPYERLTLLQLRSGRVRDALATAERAKSRALADSISGSLRLRPRGSSTVRRLTRELTRARDEYAAAHAWALQEAGPDGTVDRDRVSHLERLEARINDSLRRLQLAATSDEIADVYGAVPRATLPSLPEGTTLVEFLLAGDDAVRFVRRGAATRGEVLRDTGPAVRRLLPKLRLNLGAAARAGAEMRAPLASQCQEILGRLYQLLLGDVDLGPRCRSVVVVPHGMLHYVPFHALHDGSRYLVERVSVGYAPSAALYDVCHARLRRRTRGPALVLAHTAGGQLPHTLHESERVGAILGSPPRQEAAATRSALTEDGRRAALIHIAAHGEYRPDAPLFSHIRLADGPLTTADVFDLDLRAALVTLSACDTGRAVVGGGDELVGISRAFLYAGAAALLVSQWQVDDASTAELMARFYEALRGGTSPSEALRLAQCAQLLGGSPQNDWSHPFYWAAFQLIGAA